MGKKPLNLTAKVGVLLVRLTPAERAELDTAASAAGEATSTWLRNLGLVAARENKAPKRPAKKGKKPSPSSSD